MSNARSSSFTVQNPDALTDVLRNAAIATSESALRQGALEGARVFFREIKVRAMPHYRTGNLEDSLLISYVPEDSVAGSIATYTVTFNKKAWYARLIENGKKNRRSKSVHQLENGKGVMPTKYTAGLFKETLCQQAYSAGMHPRIWSWTLHHA